ncbi:MAG: GSCFA domain protein [Caldithrix sp.]|nr:GSCFA domain protein [Caldithrix sp.]
MQFRTPIHVDSCPFRINHRQPILTIGSCFSEHIAHLLQTHRFRVRANPFGVLYNPLSIHSAVDIMLQQKLFSEDDLVFNQDEWHSFYHHSSFSHHEPRQAVDTINQNIAESHAFLQSTDLVICTLGTAFVYFLKTSGQTVANCHKLPPDRFDRRMLSVEDISQALTNIIQNLRRIRPELKFIFTVSPIRHLKDGLVHNQQSKATLILGVHEAIKNRNLCYYFPSYEIMMDDLRDYRFYEDNLTHPNNMAVEYIWKKFAQNSIDNETQQTIKDLKRLHQAKLHRPRNIKSPAHQQFLKKQIHYLDYLRDKYRYLDFQNDYQYFKNQLNED